MAAPFEIIAAPFEVYLAPIGSAFPDLSITPPGPWVILGTSGNKNYHEDGITVAHEQTIEVFRPLGTTAPRKAFRTEEELMFTAVVADLSASQYAQIINRCQVTAVAAATGVGGQSRFELLQGPAVSTFAVVVRGAESAGGPYNTQWQVPLAYNGGNPELVLQKSEPAGLQVEFHALWDSGAGFGRYISQTAAAL